MAENWWPDNLLDELPTHTPLTVLNEQARGLTERTDRVLEGVVVTTPDGERLQHQFLIHAPVLGIRVPLLRRARRGALDAARLAQYLLAVAIAELTVLYLAVGDLVVKPSGIGTSAVRYGRGVLALGLRLAGPRRWVCLCRRPSGRLGGAGCVI